MAKTECQFCRESGLKYLHEESDMVYHPQSGDLCCPHCAESILWKDCIFCYKVKKCTKPENDGAHSGCDDWKGDTCGIDYV